MNQKKFDKWKYFYMGQDCGLPTPSSTSRMPPPSLPSDAQYYLADTPEDVLSIVQKCLAYKPQPPSMVNVVYNGGTEGLLMQMLSKGCTPEVSTSSSTHVDRIMLKGYVDSGSKHVMTLAIEVPCTVNGCKDIKVESVEEYMIMKQQEHLIGSLLMNKDTLSHYGPGVREVFDTYNVSVLVGRICPPGRFDVDGNTFCHAVDFCKFYASCLRDAPYLPVLSPFQQFEPFTDGMQVKSDALYVVEIIQPHYIYNQSITLMYGTELLGLKVKHNVKAFMPVKAEPSY
jgi:hypothetical protein